MIKVQSYQSLALAWKPGNRRDKLFALFALFVLAIFMGSGIFLGTLKLPKEERKVRIEIPERVAKFILEKPKPKVKPKPKPIEKPKPKPKPTVKRQKPKQEIKLTRKQKVARKKAEESGLLALSQELSDLVDTASVDSMVSKKISQSDTSMQVARVDTAKLTENTTSGSGGVRVGTTLNQVGSTRLDSQQQQVARQLINSRVASDKPKTASDKDSGSRTRIGNYRSEEDIAFVMDRNKSKLHSIYRRARRNNPGIKGKIILEITILPSGKVQSVRIKSSELNDTKLESRIIARIKQFDFGVSNVKTVTVTYPVEFLPS